MTATPQNPFSSIPYVPVPKTGVKYTEHHEHVDVPALFALYQANQDWFALENHVSQAIRSLELCIRGYDADMQGSERGHKIELAKIEELENEVRAMDRRIKEKDQAHAETHSELHRVKSQLQQTGADLYAAQETNQQLQADLTTLLADDEAKQDQNLEQAQEDYAQLNDQYTVLEARNDKLEDENELLQGYLDLNNHLALIERMNESLDVITDRFSTKHQVKHAKMVVDYLRTLWSL
jgi:chromosome segregation ATPase